MDATERWHGACVAAYDQLRLPLATTSAVLAETFYFTVKRNLMPRAWEFIRAAPIVIAPITNEELPSLEALMHRYADRPMDFADATLVHVAEREGLNTILTIDHDDFETYRIGRNAKFRILPARVK
jgi:predicted nucleic acid-binding protein